MALVTSLLADGSDFGGVLPMTYLLDDLDVDPETKRVLGVALEKTRASLGVPDHFANGMIAKQIIEIAQTGESHPDLLCECALKKLRWHSYSDEHGDHPSRPDPPRLGKAGGTCHDLRAV